MVLFRAPPSTGTSRPVWRESADMLAGPVARPSRRFERLSSSSRMGQVGKRRIEKISETLARDILHDILDRGLTAGARLPSEAELVASYGVGKSSLREALR